MVVYRCIYNDISFGSGATFANLPKSKTLPHSGHKFPQILFPLIPILSLVEANLLL